MNKITKIIIIASITFILIGFGIYAWYLNNHPVLVEMDPTKNLVYDKVLTDLDNGSIVNLNVNDNVQLVLNNPGDGGYRFDDLVYNKTYFWPLVLEYPIESDGKLVGNFGQTGWIFSAEKSGTTNLKVTITRPWDSTSTITVFQANIVISDNPALVTE
jgi:predicted secreted protein